MTKYVLFLSIILIGGCSQKEKEPIQITIIDIGYIDRTALAKQLSIINKYNPRVIGLDFLLTTDSLDKDIPLAEELARTENMVQATMLHNNHPTDFTQWDSVEQYHPKFRFGKQGFVNISITDDSVIVRELPMRQYSYENIEFAFSYSVALQYSFGDVNAKYHRSDNDLFFEEDIFDYSYKIISAQDLLAENFDPKDLTDQIVLMGLLGDKQYSFYTDDSRKMRMSGVEFQACLIGEILN